MQILRQTIKPLVLACSVTLAACNSSDGGGGGGGGAGSQTISGTAEAPGGIVAQLQNNKSVLVAAVDIIFPPAYAAITGLEPVGGATVQLIRIDDDGNQVGDVLAETVTSLTGDYSIALPTGVSLAGNIIVRITGNSGASMSAMVVDQAVDINPISQFVLDKFVDDEDLVLADLAINEVVSLQGRVEEFDLAATADLSTMLDQLEAEVGEFVDSEIAVIEATPDDGTAAAAVVGNWHTVEIDLGMHDSDPDTTGNLFGTFAMDVLSEGLTIADAGSGMLNFTIGSTLIDAFTNYSVDNFGNTNLFHEISLGDDAGDTFSATIDANGIISSSFPFEEDLETVDIIGGANDPENDGPNFGWRYPPGIVTLYPVASGNTYVSVITEAGVRYETTDTNGDGINDAVDPDARAGDEVDMFLLLVLKEGSGMTVSSLNSDYGMVALNINLDSSVPEGVLDSSVGIVNFNTGTATIGVDALDVKAITRTPTTPPGVTLTPDSFTEPALSADTFPYTVTDTGQVTFDFVGDGSDVLEGYTNNDGTVVAFVDDESAGSPFVTNVNNEMLMAVRLGTGMASSLNGATYNLHPLRVGLAPDGYSEVSTLGGGTVVFNADASSATVDGTDRGFSRSTDVAEVEAILPDDAATEMVFTVDSIADNGEITLSITDSTTTETLKGFVSEDGSLLIMRVHSSDTDGLQDIGIVVGVKQ